MKPRPPLPPGPFLIVGLARSGTAAARVLRERGEQVIGVDAGTPNGLDGLSDAGVELHLQADGLRELDRAGAVVKSPGVPAEAPVIAQARALGLPVLGELELAWRLLPNEFIAITGTNGKTTTVELIGHIHREANLPVAVAGNVGTALSSLVDHLEGQATIVCETSSFQLEDSLAFAPEAAVLLNLTPDHMNRHGTMAAYTAAKLQLFARQSEDDLAVLPLGPQALAEVGGHARRMYFGDLPEAYLSQRDGQLWWQGQQLLGTADVGLRGEHNLQNAMAAAAVCLARGIDPDAVRSGLRTFVGVPHRLEEVSRHAGVLYVNDSKATNVASTLVALRAFPDTPIHLILGGQAKGQDFADLRPAVQASCSAVYLIGEDAPLIAAALSGAEDAGAEGSGSEEAGAEDAGAEDAGPEGPGSGVSVYDCKTLEQALRVASAAATSGEVILLSPGCASFDQYADFEARGERFRELVQR